MKRVRVCHMLAKKAKMYYTLQDTKMYLKHTSEPLVDILFLFC